MTATVYTPLFNCVISDVHLNLTSFEIHMGAYGVVTNCKMTTSYFEWKALGKNLGSSNLPPQQRPNQTNLNTELLNAINNGVAVIPVTLYVQDQFGQWQIAFVGGIDRVYPAMHTDTISIEARDFTAVLLDTRQVLSDVNYTNQTPTGLVQQLFNKYIKSTTSPLQLPGTAPIFQVGGGSTVPAIQAQIATEPKIGPLITAQAISMNRPQTAWALIEFLSRAMGYLVFVDQPTQALYFGPANTATTPLDTWSLSWRIPNTPQPSNLAPAPGGAPQYPLKELEAKWQPRKNKSFAVIVYSQDPKSKQKVSVAATAGKATTAVSAKSLGLPIYTARIPWKSKTQALAYATGLATNIARHEWVVTGSLPMIPKMSPFDNATIAFGDPTDNIGNLTQQKLFMQSITHTFDMHGGLLTKFTANTIPNNVQQDTTFGGFASE